MPNVFQKLCVKTTSNNTVPGSLPMHCQANVSKGIDTISWTVKVGTSPLMSPKSILADRSYLTCGGGRERTNFRNHCPVCQETMTKLELLGKCTESTEGGCSWLLNLVNRAWEVIENVNTAYAISS